MRDHGVATEKEAGLDAASRVLVIESVSDGDASSWQLQRVAASVARAARRKVSEGYDVKGFSVKCWVLRNNKV